MATTSQLRSWWAGYRCNTSTYGRVSFPGVGREWSLWVAAPSRSLWEAFAQVMRDHQYLFRESAGGTYNCRRIAGSSAYSLHAYAIALDLNPSKNPYGTSRTDQPAVFRNAIKAIRVDGQQAFTWGGDWASGTDPMHWQINVSPATAGKYQIGEDQMLDRNSPKPSSAVAMFQRDLIHLGYDLGDWPSIQPSLYPKGADGSFGDSAEAGTKAFQADMELAVTGKGDALTVALAANLARFNQIRSTPSGTVDAYTKSQADGRYARKTHPHTATTTVK